jgi:hypothetical protein
VVGFLLHYIWPFLAGQMNVPNIYSGIQLTEDAWRSVRGALVPKSRTLSERIKEAWRVLLPNKGTRNLILPESDWKDAGCMAASVLQRPPPLNPASTAFDPLSPAEFASGRLVVKAEDGGTDKRQLRQVSQGLAWLGSWQCSPSLHGLQLRASLVP